MGAKLYDYTDLFREAANALRQSDYFHEALRYYEPLQQVSDYVDVSYLSELASCYGAIGLTVEAEDCYNQMIENDGGKDSTSVQLAETRQISGVTGGRPKVGHRVRTNEQQKSRKGLKDGVGKRSEKTRALLLRSPHLTQQTPDQLAMEKRISQEEVHSLFLHYRRSIGKARWGDKNCENECMLTMKSLLKHFMGNKIFYPVDKHHKFYGYSKEARGLASRPKHDSGFAKERSESLFGMTIEDSKIVTNRLTIFFRYLRRRTNNCSKRVLRHIVRSLAGNFS